MENEPELERLRRVLHVFGVPFRRGALEHLRAVDARKRHLTDPESGGRAERIEVSGGGKPDADRRRARRILFVERRRNLENAEIERPFGRRRHRVEVRTDAQLPCGAGGDVRRERGRHRIVEAARIAGAEVDALALERDLSGHRALSFRRRKRIEKIDLHFDLFVRDVFQGQRAHGRRLRPAEDLVRRIGRNLHGAHIGRDAAAGRLKPDRLTRIG